jgi:hypothetical protein
LTWAEVAPDRHRFDPAIALEIVRALPAAQSVPSRPAGGAGDDKVLQWSWNDGASWVAEITSELVAHYGDWAVGWRWAHDEGDIGGGPVWTWCCPRDSMTTPAETLGRVAQALVEWRGWIEELAGCFTRLLPSPTTASEAERHEAWRRAVTELVTVVVQRTRAGDAAWYAHCWQVLTWFLEHAGVQESGTLVTEAIGGRFESWVEPPQQLVTEVATRLARDAIDRDAQ